jgi:membrane fusion protein (multidrug efflux system)
MPGARCSTRGDTPSGTQPLFQTRHFAILVRHLNFAALLPCMLAMLLLCGCEKKEEKVEAAPPEVEVTEVVQQNVPTFTEWVAQLNGTVNADITPKVQGYLLRRDYQEGYFVKKGQLLFEIDSRPFVAALDEAKAQVARAEADLAKFDSDVQRDTPLAAQNAIPKKQLDNDLANQAAARAQVRAMKASQQQADLNLAWTRVYSPIDGIAGTANSQVGDLVGTTTKMTTVSQVNPIRAYFNISEAAYLGSATEINRIIKSNSRSNLPVQFIQANNVPYSQMGKIIFVNRQITAGTGTLQVAAEFPNKDAVLRPGGFGRVRMETGKNPNALLIPQQAVIEVQSMYQVAVVGPDSKASFRPIKVGDRVGTSWIVTEGLKPGEKVIVEGFLKVRDGTPVTPKPYSQTAAATGN